MKRAITAAALALLFCLAVAGGAFAEGPAMAVVSIREVLSRSAYTTAARQELDKLVQQKNSQLQAESQAAFVDCLFSAQELEEGQSLLAKDNRTAKEQARLQELLNISSARAAEWQTLQQKPSAELTEQQRQRLNELLPWQGAMSERKQRISARQQQMQAEVDAALEQAQNDWMQKVQQALAQVARTSNLLVVLEADSLAYWDPSLQITDKVIAALDAGASTPVPSG